MRRNEEETRRRLEARKSLLEIKKKKDGALAPEEAEELATLVKTLGQQVTDPLFLAVQKSLAATGQDVNDHEDGRLPSQQAKDPEDRGWSKLTPAEKAMMAVYGILARDGITKPEIGRRFITAVSVANGEYIANKPLFEATLPILVREGDKVGHNDISEEEWATVVRTLADQGTQPNDKHLALKTRVALAAIVAHDEGAVPSTIEIDLPDLDAQSDVEIVADNVRAMQAIYFASTLEDVKLFQVVDKIVEMFHSGMLPLGKGRAGDSLYGYWKKSINRLSEIERRNLYARGFGFAGGDPSIGNPNREFMDLWLRFVSSVSSFLRQLTVDDLLRSRTPVSISAEQVRKAGRDLAANLSLHGYGIAHFAATELQSQIQEIIELLSESEIKVAFGARDMWQVVDQVATLELGGAKNGVRYRTMANSGAIIIRWLAERAEVLAAGSHVQVLDIDGIKNPKLRARGSRPMVNPTDRDLVDACESWLAVTGTPEARVEEYSQPTEGPNLTSRPIQIPAVARDLLDSVGVQTGMGAPLGVNGSNGRLMS